MATHQEASKWILIDEVGTIVTPSGWKKKKKKIRGVMVVLVSIEISRGAPQAAAVIN